MPYAKDIATTLPGGNFAAGTTIAVPAPNGATLTRPVEELRPGDHVTTQSGPPAPIRDITRLRLALASHPNPSPVAAIRLRANALAPGLPAADLILPREALLQIPGEPATLIPAGMLANGISILHEPPSAVTTWHAILLDRHDLILAESVPAATIRAHMPPCLPMLPMGAATLALRARLNQRAHSPEFATAGADRPRPNGSLGRQLPPPVAPLRQRPGNPRCAPHSTGTQFHFALPPSTGAVRLHSRSAPSPAPQDTRRLGVCVTGLMLDNRLLPLTGMEPGPGFHPAEGDTAMQWRWTNGNAWLVLPLATTPRELSVTITDWHRNLG